MDWSTAENQKYANTLALELQETELYVAVEDFDKYKVGHKFEQRKCLPNEKCIPFVSDPVLSKAYNEKKIVKQNKDNIMKAQEQQTVATNHTAQLIGSSVGFTTGVIYSFANKTGFWKGFGIALVLSMTLGGLGFSIDYALSQKKTKN